MTGVEEFAAIAGWFATNASTVAAVGAVASAAGTVYSSEKQADALEYNAEVDRQNAGVARNEAAQREDDQRRKGREYLGRQLAASSESGTELTGSNLDMLSTSLYGIAADSANIRYEGERKASGLQAQADLNEDQAGSTRTGGYISAAGKVVSGFGAAAKLLKPSSSYTDGGTLIPN